MGCVVAQPARAMVRAATTIPARFLIERVLLTHAGERGSITGAQTSHAGLLLYLMFGVSFVQNTHEINRVASDRQENGALQTRRVQFGKYNRATQRDHRRLKQVIGSMMIR